MSTDFFAGQLCATHIGCRVSHHDLDPALGWKLTEVRHNDRYPTVKVWVKGVRSQGQTEPVGSNRVLILAATDVLTVSVR